MYKKAIKYAIEMLHTTVTVNPGKSIIYMFQNELGEMVFHNTDGPAVVYINMHTAYYLYGEFQPQ